jgi:hypothetical protein
MQSESRRSSRKPKIEARENRQDVEDGLDYYGFGLDLSAGL